MAALPENIPIENRQPVTTRRKRYERSPSQEKLIGLTPTKVQMLCFLAELRFLSLPQLAKLCCPSERQDLSEKSARRHLRELFDAGLANVLPVSRAALAPLGVANDASLLHGSAPNIYVLTMLGLQTLYQSRLIEKETFQRKTPMYGPKNSLFLAHELAARDVYTWLQHSADIYNGKIEKWHDGEAAVIPLIQNTTLARPDAWFVLRLPKVVLVGLVEVDRGTERGDRHWQKKIENYTWLYSNDRLYQTTGYKNARGVVTAPHARRLEKISEIISEHGAAIADKFWLIVHENLSSLDIISSRWMNPNKQEELQLVSPALIIK